MTEGELLTPRETARLLRVSERTLWAMLQRGDAPRAIDLSPPGAKRRLLRFRRAALISWLTQREEKGPPPPDGP